MGRFQLRSTGLLQCVWKGDQALRRNSVQQVAHIVATANGLRKGKDSQTRGLALVLRVLQRPGLAYFNKCNEARPNGITLVESTVMRSTITG